MSECPITDCRRCTEITHTCDAGRNPSTCSHYIYKTKKRSNDNTKRKFDNSPENVG